MENFSNKDNQYGQFAVVQKFEDKLAVLILDDGQKINWPIKNLPDDVKQGSQLRIVIFSSASQQEERKNIAKELINEILQN
ncbi:MAG: DUF3006 domain-containing protein [Patescibacteria group bacterium]